MRLIGNRLWFKCFAGCKYEAVLNALRDEGRWPGATCLEGTAASSEAEVKRSAEQRRAYATGIWNELSARCRVRPANYLLEPYMESRGLSAPETALFHFPPPGEDPERELAGDDPAIVLPVRDKTGQLKGIQATWLDWSLTKKRDREPKRQMYGLLKGNFIELVKFDYVNEKSLPKLIIGEGTETVLSAMTITGLPGIATCGSVADVDPPVADEYIILIDCEDEGSSRKNAGLLALKLLGGKTPPVVRLAMPVPPEGGKSGYDWNDALVEPGADEEKLHQAILDAPEFSKVQTETEKVEARLNALEALWSNDTFAYERERKHAARELNIRTAALDREMARRAARVAEQGPAGDDDEYLKPVEPWPDAVDGKELLNDILDVLDRHVVLTASQNLAAGLWVLHTYAHDAADNSPILDVSSPTPRCGKTQFLETMGLLVSKPVAAAVATRKDWCVQQETDLSGQKSEPCSSDGRIAEWRETKVSKS